MAGNTMHILSLIAALLLTLSAQLASAREHFTRELALRAMEATDASDEAWLNKALSADFVAIRGRGELVTREQFLSDARSLRDTKRFVGLRRSWTDVKIQAVGDAAVFVGRSTWQPARSEVTGSAVGSALITQQWHYHEEEWKLMVLQIVRLPLPPQVRAYRSGDLQLQGMLFHPVGNGPFPTIVYLHGNEPDPSDLCETIGPELAARGYIAWCPHRRGSGLSREQGENLLRQLTEVERREGLDARSRLALAQLEGPHLADVTAAIAYAKALPIVDSRRVFLMGNSFGGVLALLAAERDMGVSAVADFAGGALNWERSTLFRERLLQAARNATVPIFLGQAANDFSTGPTVELGKALTEAHKRHKAVIYPAFGLTRGEGHGLGVDGPNVWAADVLPFFEAAAR
jgi:dienelactone hydrolase